MVVRVEKDGPVTTIINDRPEARNAVDPETGDALVDAFLEFDNDPKAHVAVFWGAGGAFCSGWDLKFVSSLKPGEDPLENLHFPKNGKDATPRGPLGPSRLDLSKPVIGAVAGPAVAGGMELALWCDIRVMEEDAYIGVYCRRWGVPLIDGGTVRLPRLVGHGRAMEIILTGRQVMAEECLAIGACEKVVPSGQSREAAEAMAQEIARFPQACMNADRRSVYLQHGLTVREGLEREWHNSVHTVDAEGIAGATRFAQGKGRHGDYEDI